MPQSVIPAIPLGRRCNKCSSRLAQSEKRSERQQGIWRCVNCDCPYKSQEASDRQYYELFNIQQEDILRIELWAKERLQERKPGRTLARVSLARLCKDIDRVISSQRRLLDGMETLNYTERFVAFQYQHIDRLREIKQVITKQAKPYSPIDDVIWNLGYLAKRASGRQQNRPAFTLIAEILCRAGKDWTADRVRKRFDLLVKEGRPLASSLLKIVNPSKVKPLQPFHDRLLAALQILAPTLPDE